MKRGAFLAAYILALAATASAATPTMPDFFARRDYTVGTGPSPGDVLVETLHGQSPSSGLPDIVAPDTSGGVMVLINKTK